MGSGISVPAQLFKKQLLRVNKVDYEPLYGEAPGIRRQNQFDWSSKIEIKNKLRGNP